MRYTVTEVETEDIYRYLESLRKIGVNAYVLQWAKNEGSNFIIKLKDRRESNIKFDVMVEAKNSYTERGLKEDLKFVSNKKFREILKDEKGK